jgi:hypothetical protein
MTALIVAEAAAILLLGLLVAGLLRSHAEILRRLHQLGVGLEEDSPTLPVPLVGGGRPARDLSGVTPDDQSVSIAMVGVAHNTLLAFLSSGCSACADFWEALRLPERLSLPDHSRLVVVTKGPEQESVSAIGELAPPSAPTVMSGDAWNDYGVPGSPYFVYVDGPTGRVKGEGTARTWDQVRDLLAQALGDARRPVSSGRRTDAYREARADQELLAAGIYPGHPSLYREGEER